MGLSELNVIRGVDQLHEQLILAIDTGRTAFIQGDAGCGKTVGIEEFCTNWQRFPKVLKAKPIFFSMFGKQITDALAEGVPFPSKSKHCTLWLPDEFIRTIWDEYQTNPARHVIIFIDEVSHVDEQHAGFLYGIADRRKFGRHDLPPQTTVIFASNGQDSGAVSYTMDAMIGDRCNTTWYCGPTLNEWIAWNSEKGYLHPWIAAALKQNPKLLYDFDPERLTNATYRGWTNACITLHAAQKLFDYFDSLCVPRFIAGIIGDEGASAVQQAAELMGVCPSYQDIMLNPTSALIPDSRDIGALLYVAQLLVNQAQPQDLAKVVRYASRLPDHALSYLLKPLAAKHPVLMDIPGASRLFNKIKQTTHNASRLTRTQAGKF